MEVRPSSRMGRRSLATNPHQMEAHGPKYRVRCRARVSSCTDLSGLVGCQRSGVVDQIVVILKLPVTPSTTSWSRVQLCRAQSRPNAIRTHLSKSEIFLFLDFSFFTSQ